MITLERLVELRADKALNQRLMELMRYAFQLVAIDPTSAAKALASGRPVEAFADAKVASEATALVLYEETRRPFIELLRDIDKSAVVRARPHLHARLKELLDEKSE